MSDFLERHAEIANEILESFLSNPRDKVLHLYLKSYFKSERKYGKRDRKQISDLVYMRIVQQLLGLPGALIDIYQNRDQLDAQEIAANNSSKFLQKIRTEPLSGGMTVESIVRRILSKSRTFFYAPHLSASQTNKLVMTEGVPSVAVGESIADQLGDTTKFIVQDISSQKIWQHVPALVGACWDVCSGAGGKAIMLQSLYPELKLYCSDIRKGSLYNLLDRFDYMQLPAPQVFTVDMSEPKEVLPFGHVEGILTDVPCSGSATWHRQPEQALTFDLSDLKRYTDLQKNISANSLPFLTDEGLYIYVTCSYFRAENEDVIIHLQEKYNLSLLYQGMLDYYEAQGDALFVAVMRYKKS